MQIFNNGIFKMNKMNNGANIVASVFFHVATFHFKKRHFDISPEIYTAIESQPAVNISNTYFPLITKRRRRAGKLSAKVELSAEKSPGKFGRAHCPGNY